MSPAGRARCPRCDRPLITCLCAWVRPTANQVRVALWQHPDEVRQAKGSATLLALSLQSCERWVSPEGDLAAPLPAPWLQPGAALLYPADADTPPAGELPRTLVVLDGTWRHSRAMLRAQPALAALPRVAIPEALLAAHGQRYRVRKAHRPGQLSTLEAVTLALGHLEGDPARYTPVREAFDGWVDTLLARAGRSD